MSILDKKPEDLYDETPQIHSSSEPGSEAPEQFIGAHGKGFRTDDTDDDSTSPVRSLEPKGSILDVIRAEQEELASSKSQYISVAGYEKAGMKILYRRPADGKELTSIGKKVTAQFKDLYSRNLYVAVDTMIALCEGIYVQPEDVEEPVMLDPDELGYPVQFDERLAEIIGMRETDPDYDARGVVRRLFGGNDIAIISHSEKLSRWLANSKADVESEMWEV